jgi:hypothetical protein
MNKMTIRILASISAIRVVVDTPAITQFDVFKQVWRPGVILERQPETLAL